MSLILSGTDGLSDVDGTAATPAIRGTDANTGIFFGTDIIGFSEGGVEAARFNADSQFVAAAGTAALPVITTTGDTNTGIFFPAADTIAFSEGGVESMRIASGAISGAVVATQANQETATSTTTIVTPGRQQFHPSAAKAWIQCNNFGTIAGSYNVASIADTGTGVVTVTLTTAFSSTNYAVLGSGNGGGGGLFIGAGITSASVFTLVSFNTVTQAPQDSGIYHGVAFGDQ